MTEKILNFLKKHWLLISLGVLALLVIQGLTFLNIFKGVSTWFSNMFGNPDKPQAVPVSNPNIIDASLNTIAGGNVSQTPDDRTRATELAGLLKGAYGDRSWSDLMDSPVGFEAFMLTGNDDYLKN